MYHTGYRQARDCSTGQAWCFPMHLLLEGVSLDHTEVLSPEGLGAKHVP
jgi:hypothetical protein